MNHKNKIKGKIKHKHMDQGFKSSRALQVVGLVVVLLLAAFLIINKTKPGGLKGLFGGAAAVYPGATWQTAQPSEVSMDAAQLQTAMSNVPWPAVVIRSGKLVASKCQDPANPTSKTGKMFIGSECPDLSRTGLIWSASKSVTALMAGSLIQQGKINYSSQIPANVSGSTTKVYTCPDNPNTPNTGTLSQFMSMTSDFGLGNDSDECNDPAQKHNPGNHFAYNNGGVHHYGMYMVNQFYGAANPAQALRNSFVNSLQFQDPLVYDDSTWAGRNHMSGWNGGWSMSTRDLARIGYLVLRNGNWNGTQLLDSKFIDDLYVDQIPATATESQDFDDSFYNEGQAVDVDGMENAYSFGFWLPHGGTNGIFGGKAVTEATSMSGAYGTSMHISRSKDLVIAAANTNTTSSHSGGKISGATLDAIANSITGTAPATYRIAISSDGNDHDCDDLTATAMSIALLAKSGNAGKLVYYGYNDHVWSSNRSESCAGAEREEQMRISAVETANKWGGFNLSAFYSAKTLGQSGVNPPPINTTAFNALVDQINSSLSTDKLVIIGAGPMEMVGRALNAADSTKRQYVTVISHSNWNDNHADTPELNDLPHTGWTWSEMQTAFPSVTFTHITDQNAGLRVNESNYTWLQQSSDTKLNWLWQRHQASGLSPTFDPSDAGMIYWLITGGANGGDQNATPEKLRNYFGAPPASTPQSVTTLTLVNADSASAGYKSEIMNLPVATTTELNLATLPTKKLNIIAKTNPITVGSVVFKLDTTTWPAESVAPYAMAGDTSGNYNPWTPTVGSHTLTVTPYSGSGGGGNPGSALTVSFNVIDQAPSTPKSHLGLNPASLSFSAVAGDPAPAAQMVTLANSGSGNSSWSTNASQSWCHVSPSSGSLANGANVNLSVSVDALTQGNRSCSITFNDSNADNSPQTLSISYNVIAPPATPSHINLNPTSLPFGPVTTEDPAPAPKTVTLGNSGSGTGAWNAASNQNWCHVAPASGTLSAGGSASLSVSVDEPSNVGTFSCSITVSDTNADNSPQAISVSYTVNAVPTPAATPSITSFTVTAKTATTATITWTTNVPTTGTVRYGTNSKNLSLSKSNTTIATTHTLTLTGLTAKTTYYYKIEAANSSGTASTIVSNFRTKPR